MPRVRYKPASPEQLLVVPAGSGESYVVKRMHWVDLPPEVVGKRPSKDDLGSGLLAQGDWVDGKFDPHWELEAAAKAQKSRATEEE